MAAKKETVVKKLIKVKKKGKAKKRRNKRDTYKRKIGQG